MIKSKKFSLPGRKALSSSEKEWSVVIIDVEESPIERPKKAVRPRVFSRRKRGFQAPETVILNVGCKIQRRDLLNSGDSPLGTRTKTNKKTIERGKSDAARSWGFPQ